MEIAVVKAREPGERDRIFVTRHGKTKPAAVHVVHDLPHLVVESLFKIDRGLWGELAAGAHDDANRSTTARDPKRAKQGHIVAGFTPGARTRDWLTDEHRLAKQATNSVVNRWGQGPDTAEGVRARLSDRGGAGDALLAGLSDATIEMAIRGVRQLYRLWYETAPGGTLRLTWPLSPSFFTDTTPRPSP